MINEVAHFNIINYRQNGQILQAFNGLSTMRYA